MSDIAFNEEILKAVDLGSTRNETTTDKKSDAINAVNTKLNQTRKVSQQQLEGNLSRSTQKFQSQTEQEDKRSNQSAENQKILRNSSEENRDVLPIDAHRDTILNKINSDRVVIIHGETG